MFKLAEISAENKVKLDLSFRQVNKFNSSNRKITFFLSISFESISSGSNIKLKAYLIKNGIKKEKKVICTSQNNINIKKGNKEQADFILMYWYADDNEIIFSDYISDISNILEDYQKSPKKR